MYRSRLVGRSLRYLPAAVVAAALLALLSTSASAKFTIITVRDPASGRTAQAVDGRVIVVTRAGATATQMRALFHQAGAVSARPICHALAWVVELPPGQSVARGVERYSASSLVARAGPDILEQYAGVRSLPLAVRDRPQIIPNDPMWGQLWGMQKIGADAAWDTQTGSPTVVCAVIDSGTDYTHPDLTGREWINAGETAGDGIDNDNNGYVDDVRGWDFLDNDNDPGPADASGFPEPHGTHVAGTVGATANNATGVVGVTWTCKLMLLRIGNAAGLPTSASYEAITYAADNGADVANMSYGGMFDPGYDTPLGYAYGNGVVLCAATGNSAWEFTLDPNTWDSPVCNDGIAGVDNKVIGVSASDENDLKTDFSNYGGAYKFVDVCAPGINILSTVPGGIYESWAGTSMACPHVVGLAGLVVSEIGKDKPQAIIDQIRDTAVNIDALNPMYAGKLGTGRIDAAEAVNFDAPPRPATTVNAFDTANDEGGSCTITWRKSPDDGAGRGDVVGYELWRGTQPDPTTSTFVRVADRTALPAGKSGYIDANPHADPKLDLVDGQNYYYYVRTFDSSFSADSTVSAAASPRDDSSPPAIANLLAQDTQADNGRSITLSWVGYTGSADLQQFKVYRSLAEFTSVTEDDVELVAEGLSPSTRNYVDKATDPNADPTDPEAQPLDQTDYWYAVTALDEVGNAVTTVTPTGPAQCAPNLSITFSYGLRMITVPAEPIDPSPVSVFGFTDATTAQFARYDSLSQSYHTVAQNPDDPYLTIVPGRAFWLNRDLPSFIGVGGRLVDEDETEVALGQGWNQIGCPYDAEYPFEGITVRDSFGTDTAIVASNQGLVRKYGWRYDAFQRSYRLVSATLPGADTALPQREGVWVHALQAGAKLVFAKNVVVPAEAPAASPAKLDGWQIRLIAKTAKALDTDNFIGVTSAAPAIGRIVSPPPVAGGVDLYLAGGGTERLATDLRKTLGAKAEWQVTVECAQADADVELSWPDLTTVPNDLRPVLKDLATGRSVYMRTATGYTYHSRAAGEQRKFEIVLAGPAVGPVVTQMAATPAKAGGVELTYTLARTADVTIEVRNLAGRLVATVAAPQGQVGLNRVLWNGQAAGGQGVPSGRYVISITAVADDNGETVRALKPVTLAR